MRGAFVLGIMAKFLTKQLIERTSLGAKVVYF